MFSEHRASTTSTRRTPTGLLSLALTLALPLVGVEREAAAQVQACRDCNVILIAIDTLRADHLGTYGYDRSTSPNIDAFAEEARVFTNFYSNSSWTVPSFSAMFTSLYPSDVKMQLPADKLDDRFTTIAEILKQNGYATVGFNSPTPVSRNGGFFQGFDSFTVVQPDRQLQDTTLLVPQALEWLDANKDKKFFMFFHTFEVHDPFCPPDEFDRFRGSDETVTLGCVDIVAISKHNRGEESLSTEDLVRVAGLYDADLLHADHNLGTFFDRLEAEGLFENTIVVVTADHGEELGERDVVGHGYSLSNELVHVPLIIKAPNLSPGTESNNASTIDIAPTILELVGIARPAYFKGRTLTELGGGRIIYQETSAPLDLIRELDRIIASAQAGQNEVRQSIVPALKESIIQSNWKYTVDNATDTRELYDLRADPGEERNLIGIDARQARALRETFEAFRRDRVP
ncbi:MAG TPA: sulfatase [Gammaproteobacteria bacterium]|nr:sulfatase [Gammaproteobacteria bacterium]